MAKPSPLRGIALTLGLVGAGAGLVGMVLLFTGTEGVASPSAGILIRVGAVLLAVSLVLPSVRRPSTTTVIVTGVALALVMLRPALIWVGLIGWIAWLVLGRQRSTADRDS